MLSSAKPYHDELQAACKQFAQGDLLQDLLTTYIARADVTASNWARHFPYGQAPPNLVQAGVSPPPEPPFFIILDQTCDVQKLSIPFVHASPVYNAALFWKSGDLVRIRAHTGFDYLYALTVMGLENYLTDPIREVGVAPAQPEESLWVADLRIQVPLDKGVLVGRNALSAFADPSERLRFGDLLGDRRSRPALPNVIQDDVAPLLAEARGRNELLLGIEFRVKVDSQISPSQLELVLILTDDGPTPTVVEEALASTIEAVQSVTGIRCTIRSCGTAVQVSAADYRDSVFFSPEELSE